MIYKITIIINLQHYYSKVETFPILHFSLHNSENDCICCNKTGFEIVILGLQFSLLTIYKNGKKYRN